MAEQLLATMQQMQANQQQMLQAMQSNQQDLLQRVQAAETRAAAAEQRSAETRSGLRAIDQKDLDRVDKFDGRRKAWPDWSFSFRAILDDETKEAMRWACAQVEQIDGQSIDLENKTWLAHNAALYKALVTKANAGEAATKIRAAGEGMGLEAWRMIVEYYEPRTRGRQREIFKKINRPTLDRSKSLLNNIESWELSVRDYEKGSPKSSMRIYACRFFWKWHLKL